MRTTICISFWASRDLKRALERMSQRKGMTLSQVIIKALKEYLDREE